MKLHRLLLPCVLLLLWGDEPRTLLVAQRTVRLSGVVTRVADGDTLDLESGGLVRTIRLDGIDAPEADQPYCRQARLQLRLLALSRSVKARITDYDRHGRTVARVSVGATDLSEEMVRSGLAWHYASYSADQRLADLERQARRQRRGLWADPKPVAPWLHRRESPARTTPEPPAARSRPPRPLAGPYHGNVSSRVYHAPGCRHYDCRQCTEAFMTRESAEAAGYRPHKTCVEGR